MTVLMNVKFNSQTSNFLNSDVNLSIMTIRIKYKI